MNEHIRTNAIVRTNADPTGLIIEQINEGNLIWKDWLVKQGKENYYNRNHRYEVMNNDPLVTVYTERFFIFVTSKTFKSYTIARPDEETGEPIPPEEIMSDLWERWDQLNIKEMFIDAGKYMVGDGYVLNHKYLYPDPDTGQPRIGYHNYGFYHCPPSFWRRYNMPRTPYHNKIYEYYIQYIPKPQGAGYMGNYHIHAVTDYLYPTTPGFDHFTRIKHNEAIGVSKLQKLWASFTKLRKIAWYDFVGSCRKPLLQIPADMDPKEADALAEAFAHWDEHNMLVLPLRVNPETNEVEPYPAAFEATPDATGPTAKADPSSAGTMLHNAEYARVLMVDGHSETHLVGSQPGQLESSKMDLTRDDRADISEFNLYQPMLKKINMWLLEVGALEGLDPETLEYVEAGNYDIKCHIEWEVLENMMAAAEMAEEEMAMKSEGAKQEGESKANASDVQKCPECGYSGRMRPRKGDTFVCPQCNATFTKEGKKKGLYYSNEARYNERLSPYVLTNGTITILGYRCNAIQGMQSVKSDTVDRVGLFQDDLLVQFENYPPGGGTYEYHFDSPAEAEGMYDAMMQPGQSKGEFVWSYLRGTRSGPAYLTGNPTAGGTSASIVPYDIQGGILGGGVSQPGIPPIPAGGGLGPAASTTGFGGVTINPPSIATPQPIGFGIAADPTAKKVQPVGTAFTITAGGLKTTQAPEPHKISPSKTVGRKRKPGKKSAKSKAKTYAPAQVKAGPAVRIGNMSFKRFNEFLSDAGIPTVGKTTWEKFKDLNNYSQFRYNSAIGNGMNFDIPLSYKDNEGNIFQEYACKKEWKKIENHSGDLVIYDPMGKTRGHSGDMVKVGTYDHWWDEDKDTSVERFNYDKEAILKMIPKDSPMAVRITAGLEPEMSTEYFTGKPVKHNGKQYQVNFHNNKGERKYIRIALVDYGNCPTGACDFTEVVE